VRTAHHPVPLDRCAPRTIGLRATNADPRHARVYNPLMRNLALLTALAALPTLALAQEPAPTPAGTPFTEQVEVTEVLLDAQVTDPAGNVIVGLGKNDFKVTENGKPVDLNEVTFYSSRARLDAAGQPVAPAQAQRLYILFFDDQRHINTEIPGVFSRELDAARRAREWVRALGPNDYLAVASFDTSLAVETDFTRDRKAMQKAIDEATTGKGGSGNWPSRMPPEGELSLLRNLPKGNAVRDQTPTVYEALQVLAKASSHLVGRKNLVLFSTGFGRMNSFAQFEPDPRYDTPTLQALNDANVAVYAVDLHETDAESPLSSALTLMSSQTGGRYFQNIVNFTTPLEQIAGETTGYYLLAYSATHKRGETGYQKVDVAVVNPGFKVKAREGYLYGG
jgi:VWFA-related protein